MKIAPADSIKPHGLENAIQRVQANMDRRAARSQAGNTEGNAPGANALARLQANLDRKIGGGKEIEITPVEPAPPGELPDPASVIPAPAPDPNTGAGGLLDLLV